MSGECPRFVPSQPVSSRSSMPFAAVTNSRKSLKSGDRVTSTTDGFGGADGARTRKLYNSIDNRISELGDVECGHLSPLCASLSPSCEIHDTAVPHVKPSGAPEMRTYFAQFNKDCPFQCGPMEGISRA